MVYAYVRVSSDKQSLENQEYEIYKYADNNKLKIQKWVKETISSRKKIEERELFNLIQKLNADDILLVSEISRLGRNIMEVMNLLKECMEKDVKVYSIKENYKLGNNIESKVLAFAFSLSAEIERDLISQRTKEALARKKSEGKTLGRPKGSLSKETKLSGKEIEIKELLDKKVSLSAISRIYGVHRITVKNFVDSRILN
ncbi:MAG: master DNA invertase Mpi family serine-type recombinase [Bacteroidetes bacterium]|nr:master DNA invertase Mpi family serine-type recombinase [Bacteroidota bacterium]